MTNYPSLDGFNDDARLDFMYRARMMGWGGGGGGGDGGDGAFCLVGALATVGRGWLGWAWCCMVPFSFFVAGESCRPFDRCYGYVGMIVMMDVAFFFFLISLTRCDGIYMVLRLVWFFRFSSL